MSEDKSSKSWLDAQLAEFRAEHEYISNELSTKSDPGERLVLLETLETLRDRLRACSEEHKNAIRKGSPSNAIIGDACY